MNEDGMMFALAEVLDAIVGEQQCPRKYSDHEHVGFSVEYELIRKAQRLVAAVQAAHMLGASRKQVGKVVSSHIEWSTRTKSGRIKIEINLHDKDAVPRLAAALEQAGFGRLLIGDAEI